MATPSTMGVTMRPSCCTTARSCGRTFLVNHCRTLQSFKLQSHATVYNALNGESGFRVTRQRRIGHPLDHFKSTRLSVPRRIAFRRLLAKHKNFTAVVACSDVCALGCMDAMAEMGWSVPNNTSIIGNNDIPFLSRMKPGLTTVSVPKYEMGQEAFKLLLKQLSNPSEEPEEIRLIPRLIIRESSGPMLN